ncbi:uncharacterized protein LOC132702745 [Cylas formicarius]|uniref:uncharacterized protein LOC132702745 n=1 Tax=Cylas formicarius TaxID=197179 RepID=UPI00295875B9|nr:uncharacterized protein LOC132702745 [Cylas formicarius]
MIKYMGESETQLCPKEKSNSLGNGVNIEYIQKSRQQYAKELSEVYHALSKGLINDKEVSRNTKVKVYKDVNRPILIYGCETWVLSERQESKVNAAEIKYLRRVKGVTRKDKIINDDIRAELKVKRVKEYTEQRQLGWWGHLQRLNSTVPIQKMWESRPTGRRKRGKPRKIWNETIDKILIKKGKICNGAMQIALDKKR